MEVVQAYPEFAQIIEDVANGVPVQVAIARQFDPSELAVPEGEPDYDAYKKAATERSQRLADMKAPHRSPRQEHRPKQNRRRCVLRRTWARRGRTKTVRRMGR